MWMQTQAGPILAQHDKLSCQLPQHRLCRLRTKHSQIHHTRLRSWHPAQPRCGAKRAVPPQTASLDCNLLS